ncbi:methyl-accepting chemotaxis protein [Roseomonas sp. USHLN139]|uniref:methyl-accepting chemotaxis protein n=1 Tax=Roseomonas sp. USHLN139 TaxID=3081298 RepID=UPI003B019378
MAFLRSNKAAMVEKSEWLDVLANHAGVGLWDAILHEGDATHPKARWTWSPEFRRLCGFASEAEFPNVMQSWSDRLHPEDAAPTFAAFGKALASGDSYDVVYRLKVKDGSWRWFRATGGVMMDRQGKPRRACGSLVDIHAVRQAEAEQQATRTRLAAAFETEVLGVVASLAGAAEQLQQDARNMDAAAGETSQQSVSVAAAAATASGNVQTVASATEQVAASIREISQQVMRSTDATGTAMGQARGATTVVASLVEDVRRIGDVVKLISDIAGQTNLLALNATIEAARAGEAGKGFAVVASEVKTLASQTAKATEEITSRIAAVRQATDGVAQAITGVAGTIDHLNGASAAIAAAVEQQGATTAEIARSVQQLATGTAEVSATIATVNNSAERTGQVSGQITGAAGALSGQAGELRQQVMRFLEGLRAA